MKLEYNIKLSVNQLILLIKTYTDNAGEVSLPYPAIQNSFVNFSKTVSKCIDSMKEKISKSSRIGQQ